MNNDSLKNELKKEEKAIEAAEDPKDEKHQCSYCKLSFKRKNHLTLHVKVAHEGLLSNECHSRPYNTYDKQLPNCYVKKPCNLAQLLDLTDEYKTPMNDVRSKFAATLKEFVDKVGPIYMCSKCRFLAISLTKVTEHIDIKHGANVKNKFVCPECREKFSTLSLLLNHSHSYLFCKLCCKFFSSAHSLRRHCRKMHLRLKPYECCECCRKFSKWRNLNKHLRQQHGVSNPKKFSLFQIPKLKKENITSINCCNKYFTSVRNLSLHWSVKHKGSCRFNCKYCKNIFASKVELNQHLNSHHSQKKIVKTEYKCEICLLKIDCTLTTKISEKLMLRNFLFLLNQVAICLLRQCSKIFYKFLLKMLFFSIVISESSVHLKASKINSN